MSSNYKLGQVGGFPLRLSWLPRAHAKYTKDKQIPLDPEQVSRDLGIGMNMVRSLRIWGQASGIIDDKGRFSSLASTLFGRDPYFESIDSMVLIHWLICSNQQFCTANSWLFNRFHVGQFSVSDAVSNFHDFLVSEGNKYAEGTIRVDIDTTLRMYTSSHDRDPHDLDDKFLHQLGLLSVRQVKNKSVFSRTWETERPLISARNLAYAILSTLASKKTSKATLSDLYSSGTNSPSPGVVFGYTRSGFYSAVEKMVEEKNRSFAMAPLPGGDFQLSVKSTLAKECQKGNGEIAARHCLPKIH